MRPDATTRRNASPAYLRALIHAAGMKQTEVAAAIGISRRAMQKYLRVGAKHEAPYPVQYAIERLTDPKARVADASEDDLRKLVQHALEQILITRNIPELASLRELGMELRQEFRKREQEGRL